ncbi:MAG: CPBP family intramembrane glutamic endopeptidase [Chitinophagaceae bacterium]
MDNFPDLSDHILVLIYGLVIPFISGVKSLENFDNIQFTEELRRRFYLSNSLFLCLASLPVLVSWGLHDRPFDAMGFRLSPDVENRTLTFVMISLLTLLYSADLLISIRKWKKRENAQLDESTPFLPNSLKELPAYIIMCISAGVFEEIIYRGFMVTYFLPEYNFSQGLPILAVTAPAFLFSLAHYYQGWQAVLKIFLLSMLLGIIFLSGGSIWVVMLIHFLIDLTGGLVAMKLMKESSL